MYDLMIQNGSRIYTPPVIEEISICTERQNSPGSMEFSFVDTGIFISEGNQVWLKDEGKEVFYGFIFQIKRDRSNIVKVMAYDQIRYLKNKDSLVYENRTAGELIRLIAAQYGLIAGDIADTGWKIASRVEDNETLLDMIGNALDLTLDNTGNLFIFYDDYGKLNLSRLEDMYVPIVIDSETGQNYDYESSIDSDTYNQIKLIYENEKTGKRELHVVQDLDTIKEWGLLQYFDTLQEGENGDAKAAALLQLYNKPVRKLSVKDACGDSRVRGGSLIAVRLEMGNVNLQNLMLVEKCTHKYAESKHTMDLVLAGGDFSG